MSKQTELDAKAAALLDSEGAMGVARMALRNACTIDRLNEQRRSLQEQISRLEDERKRSVSRKSYQELAASVDRLRQAQGGGSWEKSITITVQ